MPTFFLDKLTLLLVIISLFTACSTVPTSPRESYISSLKKTGLDTNEIGEKWLTASKNALQSTVQLSTPFREKGYFDSTEPTALAYEITLQEGEYLSVKCTTYPKQPMLFLDLFYIDKTKNPQVFDRVMSAKTNSDSLTYEVLDSGKYILHIQPELLVSCRFDLQVLTQPLYGVFPIEGHGNKDIGSLWGAPRDGGKRKHEGIDIFAPKGTNLLSMTDGYVSSVRNSGLGGKQVWIEDEKLQQSLYYAHLDEQLVAEGENVRAGDVIGTVGNTGNARTTPPHLHLGIYVWDEAAVDPLPFVKRQKTQFADIQLLIDDRISFLRTKNKQTAFYNAPDKKAISKQKIPQYTAVEIIGTAKNYYHVQLLNGEYGYLRSRDISLLEKPLKTQKTKQKTELLEAPNAAAPPFASIEKGKAIGLLAKRGNFWLVELTKGRFGWLSNTAF